MGLRSTEASAFPDTFPVSQKSRTEGAQLPPGSPGSTTKRSIRKRWYVPLSKERRSVTVFWCYCVLVWCLRAITLKHYNTETLLYEGMRCCRVFQRGPLDRSNIRFFGALARAKTQANNEASEYHQAFHSRVFYWLRRAYDRGNIRNARGTWQADRYCLAQFSSLPSACLSSKRPCPPSPHRYTRDYPWH